MPIFLSVLISFSFLNSTSTLLHQSGSPPHTRGDCCRATTSAPLLRSTGPVLQWETPQELVNVHIQCTRNQW
jgi:hypothetical protein